MRSERLRQQGGYTLVEIVMVVAVIGLIMGGISLGRDVMREAEFNRIHSKFLMPWKQAYDLHFQRTGVVVGDSQIAPTLMVNGAEATFDNENGMAGVPENYQNTGRRICEGQGYQANSVGLGDPSLAEARLHSLFDRVGVQMPAGRTVGREDRYVYSDSNGNAAEVQVCFQWNPDRTISGSGNVMVVRGLTPALARKLDALIDGSANATEGQFRQQNAFASNPSQTSQRIGSQWQANNTFSAYDPVASATGSGSDRDEDRVMLVTAHWIMER